MRFIPVYAGNEYCTVVTCCGVSVMSDIRAALELLRSSDNDSLERRAIVVVIVVVIVVEKILSSSKRIESEVAAVVDISALRRCAWARP